MGKQTVEEYIKSLSAADGLPGGGSAAALVGTMSVALGKMVTEVYGRRKKATSQKNKINTLHEKTTQLMEEIESLMEKDAQAFEVVSKAYQLPKKTKEEKVNRAKEIEASLAYASNPPIELMEKSNTGIGLLEQIISLKITGSIVNDIAVGLLFAKVALEAAYLNVLVNTKMMKNKEERKKLEDRARRLKETGIQKADKLYQDVLAYLQDSKWPGVKTDAGGSV